MSVSLALFKKEPSGEYTLLFDTPVSFQSYYNDVWKRAIEELGIEIFRAWSVFDFDEVPQVLDELKRLLDWAQVNADDYMTDRIEGLLKMIPELCEEYGSREDASEIEFDLG